MKQSVEIVCGSPNFPLTGPEPTTSKSVEPQHGYKFKDPNYSKGNDTYPILGSMANFVGQKLINGDKYFVHPFYDLQQSIITASRDPVIEVAGPTTSGYAVLDGLALFSKPIVTNIGSSEKYSEPGKFDQLTENDKTMIDVIASASHLPFPDRSLGILLGSCLPKIDLRLLHDGRANEDQMNQMLKLVAERASAGLDIEPWRDISPRVGFWLEAARTVRKGGLIIQ